MRTYDPPTTADEMTDDQPRYSLSELTDEAGVSVRTVRYYIAEGLLPPPVGAGPRSAYTQTHLDRLRLIDRMKTAYLPLKEIRRRLTALDDADVHRLAAQEVPAPPPPSAQAARTIQESAARPLDSASSYITRLLHRQSPSAPAAPPSAPLGAALRAEMVPRFEAITPHDEPGTGLDMLLAAPTLSETLPPADAPTDVTATSWRRIPIGDDAELLIRDDTYQRKHDRIDWLVGWARKVLG